MVNKRPRVELSEEQTAFVQGFVETGTFTGAARVAAEATGRELVHGYDADNFATRMASGMPMRQILPQIYLAAGFEPEKLIANLVDTALNATTQVRLNKFEVEDRPDYKARNEATELLFKMLGAMDAAKVMKSKTSIHITHTEAPLGDSPFEPGGNVIDGTSRPA